jgi:hypothetical protein
MLKYVNTVSIHQATLYENDQSIPSSRINYQKTGIDQTLLLVQ